ncbi:hypothetical protein CVT24_006929 [Panaeolus cyanescens]|uniref:NAD(P)-binding protein n=1 Tax=Panaeolus cyanescens TaxID=181874 RepID=A0A409VK86_9AGAR|nr:hypothetical protein CVT24_006929 [Panaeolus cyanescens]
MGGCLSRKTGDFHPVKDIQDLTGRVVIVTGGNGGIGYHTIKFLARAGAKVYLGARSEAKAKAAIAQLKEDGIGSGEVVWLKMDFSNARYAKKAAEDFLEREGRLDILSTSSIFVNNAAQLTGPLEITKDGISSLAIVNHFSTFVFTRTLLPLLIKTSNEPNSDVRIVTLSSIAHTTARPCDPNIHFREASDFNHEFANDWYPDWSRYAITKLCNLLFANELQRKLDALNLPNPILSIPIHPGEVNTFADRTPWPVIAGAVMGVFFMRPEPGSYTSLFAGASPLVRNFPGKYKGRYLEPVGWVGEMSENAKREDLAGELWETTERLLRDMGVEVPVVGEC